MDGGEEGCPRRVKEMLTGCACGAYRLVRRLHAEPIVSVGQVNGVERLCAGLSVFGAVID